jgi:hypothetical protein
MNLLVGFWTVRRQTTKAWMDQSEGVPASLERQFSECGLAAHGIALKIIMPRKMYSISNILNRYI